MAEAAVILIHDHAHAIRHHPDHRARARVRARRRPSRQDDGRPGDLPAPARLRRCVQPHDGQLRRRGRRRPADARGHAWARGFPRRRQRLSHAGTDEAGPIRLRERGGGRRPRYHPPVLPAGRRRARELPRREGGAAAGRLHPDDRLPADARHVGLGRHAAAARRPGDDRDARGAARQRRRASRSDPDARGAGRAAAGRAAAPAEGRLPARGGIRGRHGGRAAQGRGPAAAGGRQSPRPGPPRHGARAPRGRHRGRPGVRGRRDAGHPRVAR